MTSNTQPPGDHVDELLSGYLDGELTQQQRQVVDIHMAECVECSQRFQELETVRQRLTGARLGNNNEDYWRENMNDPVTKATEGIGWLLFAGALLILTGIGIYEFVINTEMKPIIKLLTGAVYLGLGILFLSVLRQRLIERKTDKYKDVEI